MGEAEHLEISPASSAPPEHVHEQVDAGAVTSYGAEADRRQRRIEAPRKSDGLGEDVEGDMDRSRRIAPASSGPVGGRQGLRGIQGSGQSALRRHIERLRGEDAPPGQRQREFGRVSCAGEMGIKVTSECH
ncbi:hypothetical protein [Methylobacterium sp.]|uniref:hypothetical protein n=1 Tax=Methylobacterium sp. TaxID=409 RepID=UPI000FBF09A6|nr:hypothetical protein [Methylobacterium sp.]RUP18562.1 MAG: hypothetical protein EKK44_23380 [Methylobacterium sp.]